MINYTINFGDRDGLLYRIEIDNPDYTDDPIELIPSDNPLVINHEGNNDDDIFKTHIIPSSISIGVVSTGLDFDTLFYINDTSFKTRVYRDNVLYWSGHLISDGIQEVDSGVPFDVTLTAIDGLDLLSGIQYQIGDEFSLIETDEVVTTEEKPLYILRYILFWDKLLDNPLPIRWNSSLKNDAYPDSDMLSGLTELGSLFYLDKKSLTSEYMAGGIVKSAQSWLYQKAGYWYINRYFDVTSGTFNGKQITTNTDTLEVSTPYNGNELTQLLPTDTINESWFWFGKKPLGGVSVEYDNLTFDNNNVVPDGNFLYDNSWYMRENQATYTYEDSITNRNDSMSIEVDNDSDSADYLSFGDIPIDTDILYKECKIGLKWLPISGYDLTPEGNINFGRFPIHVSIKLTINNAVYYLNEFGYWSDNAILPGQNVLSSWFGGDLSLTFDDFNDFKAGDILNVSFFRNSLLESYSIVFPNDMSYSSGVVYLTTKIPDSDVSPLQDYILIIENTSGIDYEASMSKTDDYYRNLQLDAGDNFKPNDVIDFQFVSKASSGDIKMPSGKAMLSFEIYSKPGSVMRIAEVFFQVPKNNDIYDVYIEDTKNTRESYSMNISSGWSGNQITSYGDDYHSTNESELWNDGKTLTELYGRAIMDVRNRPCRVFTGTVDRVMEWGLFSLMGHVYAPLSMRVNIKDKTSDIVGVEFAPNSPSGGYVVENKSSGDS